MSQPTRDVHGDLFGRIQASVIIGSVLLLLSYILRDILYALVDPRIKAR